MRPLLLALLRHWSSSRSLAALYEKRTIPAATVRGGLVWTGAALGILGSVVWARTLRGFFCRKRPSYFSCTVRPLDSTIHRGGGQGRQYLIPRIRQHLPPPQATAGPATGGAVAAYISDRIVMGRD